MSQSYVSLFFHLVWSTKKRMPFFSSSGKRRLYGYIKTMVERDKIELLAIGGMSDHVHLLVRTDSVDKMKGFVRRIKSSSSGFVNRVKKTDDYFGWQGGFSMFSISASAVERVKHYIWNQEQHHKDLSFDEEMEFLLSL